MVRRRIYSAFRRFKLPALTQGVLGCAVGEQQPAVAADSAVNINGILPGA
ncbi:MAG: hypothetical protein JWO52_7034 [Gammaproteobacteria bacterium]|nr:hypothetical protein [Gammaproteobacteria bacterium]